MGEVAVVVIVEVVVVGQGAVAQLAEEVAKAERHGVVRGLGVAPHAGLGDKARGGHILTIGGGHPPQRRIEVFAHDALVGQFPEGGRPLGVHGQGRKALGHHPDQILSGKAPRPLVLRGGLHHGKVLVHIHQGLVVLVPLFQGGKVDVQGVDLFRALHRAGELVGLGGALVQLGQHLVIGVDTEDHPAHLQLGLGKHSKVLHLQLGGGRLEIKVAQRQHTAAAQQHQPHGDQLHPQG